MCLAAADYNKQAREGKADSPRHNHGRFTFFINPQDATVAGLGIKILPVVNILCLSNLVTGDKVKIYNEIHCKLYGQINGAVSFLQNIVAVDRILIDIKRVCNLVALPSLQSAYFYL